jgi:hypothetical protein
MKTFEERFTAWLDGALDGEDLQSFEREHASLAHEKSDFLKLRSLLRCSDHRAQLANPDFFNSQIMAEIAREKVEIAREKAAKTKPGTPLWLGLPRLAWGGLGLLSVGFALFFAVIPRSDYSDPRAKYVAEVLKTKTAEPKIKATVDNQKDMTIIKLEGLDKLPPGKDLHH